LLDVNARAFGVFNSIFAARLNAKTASEETEAAKARARRNGVPCYGGSRRAIRRQTWRSG
jgi:hypothetical protein